jgi:dihydrofolate reductase
MKELWLIAAVAENNVIGNGNALPWRIPEDLAHFKRVTLGHAMIMGRKTYDSIGKPLPGRTTVVLTRREGFSPEGVVVARDRDEAIALAPGNEVFVVGGAEIYALFLPIASRIYLTRVHAAFPGDTTFPELDPAHWSLVSSERASTAPSSTACTFELYRRNA